MLELFRRLQYRETVRGNLNALLLMYPRKRQFERDFRELKGMIRSDFQAGLTPASSALQIATGIIQNFLRQLTAEERRAVAGNLVESDLGEVEALAERRIGGERDQRGDKVFFSTRLCGMALFMAGRMAGAGALRQSEIDYLSGSIERELGVEEGTIGRAFAPAAILPSAEK